MKKIIILWSIFFNSISYAADIDCNNAITQGDMNYCACKEYEKVDKKLNQLYQKILKNISGEQINLFKKSQNLWIKYRDADCEFHSSDFYGGTAYPTIINMCLKGKTSHRIKEFEELLKCGESDLSCPFWIKEPN